MIGASVLAAEHWDFVLASNTAQVLRHRLGITLKDLVRSHAFGW